MTIPAPRSARAWLPPVFGLLTAGLASTALAAGGGPLAPADRAALERLARTITESIVVVLPRGVAAPQPTTGVIARADGLILTAASALDGATLADVALGGRVPRRARVVDRDARRDIAWLEIDGYDFDPIPFGDSDQLRHGELVFAVVSDSRSGVVRIEPGRVCRPAVATTAADCDTAAGNGRGWPAGTVFIDASGQFLGLAARAHVPGASSGALALAANGLRPLIDRAATYAGLRRGSSSPTPSLFGVTRTAVAAERLELVRSIRLP